MLAQSIESFGYNIFLYCVTYTKCFINISATVNTFEPKFFLIFNTSLLNTLASFLSNVIFQHKCTFLSPVLSACRFQWYILSIPCPTTPKWFMIVDNISVTARNFKPKFFRRFQPLINHLLVYSALMHSHSSCSIWICSFVLSSILCFLQILKQK